VKRPKKYSFIKIHRLSDHRFVHAMITGVTSSARVTARIPTARKANGSLSASLVSGSAIPLARGFEWRA